PVSRPARVPDAVIPFERVDREHFFEARQLAGAAPQLDLAVAHDRHSGRVVAAILETPQAVDQDWKDLLVADISDDAAHTLVPQSLVPGSLAPGPGVPGPWSLGPGFLVTFSSSSRPSPPC